jgi:hypothetical protein
MDSLYHSSVKGKRTRSLLTAPSTKIEPGSVIDLPYSKKQKQIHATSIASSTSTDSSQATDTQQSHCEGSVSRNSHEDWPMAEPLSLPEDLHTPRCVANSIRQIDLNRPIDTYTQAELSEIRDVADYLHVSYIDDMAFALYTHLLKRIRYESSQSTEENRYVPCYEVFKYAQAAWRPEHQEIIRNLLVTELEKAKESRSALHIFLAHEKLAESYFITGDMKRFRTHITEAVSHAALFNICEMLPTDDTRWDLILWKSKAVIWLFCVDLDIFNASSKIAEMLGWDLTEVMTTILTRTPGAFEVNADANTMGNTCIRECLEWCDNELSAIHEFPGAWETMNDEVSRGYAQCIAIFTALWARCYNSQTASASSTTPQWAKMSRHRTGVSGAEILGFVSAKLANLGPKRKKYPRKQATLIQAARLNLRDMLNGPAVPLAMHFMNRFDARIPHSNEVYEKQCAVRSSSYTHVMGSLERTLRVTVPEFPFATIGVPIKTIAIVVGSMGATLASSVRESTNSSIRRLKMAERTAAQTFGVLPSLRTRDSSMSIFSDEAMSQLTKLMDQCFNFDSFQENFETQKGKENEEEEGVKDVARPHVNKSFH